MERFALREATVLVLREGDITRTRADAIVNAANERMLGGGGVDGAIHRQAGPELRAACERVPEARPGVRCPTGEARITPAFRLPARFVIHTVGPVYRGPESAERLESAYRTCLYLARDNDVRTIAFPAISCGVFGYPLAEAAAISLDACARYAVDIDFVHFVLFGRETWDAWLTAAVHRFAPIG